MFDLLKKSIPSPRLTRRARPAGLFRSLAPGPPRPAGFFRALSRARPAGFSFSLPRVRPAPLDFRGFFELCCRLQLLKNKHNSTLFEHYSTNEFINEIKSFNVANFKDILLVRLCPIYIV